ncbi:MAG: hypothetical protein FWD73_11420 [Polyangiaceae bacterium]|nr:hypothetical protein [Polyangiaceae bacterium]
MNNPDAWPPTEVTLGQGPGGDGIVYDQTDLQRILNTQVNSGDRYVDDLVALAQALIVAKLNVAQGADDAAVSASITEADTLIGLLNPLVGDYLLDDVADADAIRLIETLSDFNEGITGPGACPAEEPDAGTDAGEESDANDAGADASQESDAGEQQDASEQESDAASDAGNQQTDAGSDAGHPADAGPLPGDAGRPPAPPPDAGYTF